MNKIITKTILLAIVCLLITSNCFAVNVTNETKKVTQNKEYVFRTYEVNENEEIDFISTFEREFELDKKKYVFDTLNKTGGNIIENIDIQTTKKIVTKSNSTANILNELPQSIEYNQDGYIGQYNIDLESLQTKSVYNGYYEQLIEDTKQYFDLSKNDLSYIPKQIAKDNITLDLIKTEWYPQTTKFIGENEVPDKYRAECYYAGKQKVDNPLTYTTTVNYKGIATKVIENPIIYEIQYKCITKDINYLPYIIGSATTVIFIVIIIFIKKKSNKEATKDEKKD